MYLIKILFSFTLSIYPEVELLDHTVDLFSTFRGNSILFSIVVESIYVPSQQCTRVPFFTKSMPALVSCLDDSLSNRCEVIISLWLLFASPWWLEMLRIYSCVWQFWCLLWKKCLSNCLFLIIFFVIVLELQIFWIGEYI